MVVGLITYVTENQEIYNILHKNLSGIAFFRKEGNKYYIKSPKNKIVVDFLEKKIISIANQQTE
jgi:hypothetical protein